MEGEISGLGKFWQAVSRFSAKKSRCLDVIFPNATLHFQVDPNHD
jgi:hypothetical protein